MDGLLFSRGLPHTGAKGKPPPGKYEYVRFGVKPGVLVWFSVFEVFYASMCPYVSKCVSNFCTNLDGCF